MQKANKEDGQIMVLALGFSAVLMILISGMVSYWMSQIGHHRQAMAQTQAVSIAEAGLELAIWKMNNVPGYLGETATAFGAGQYNITITNQSSTTKLIRADAYVPSIANPKGKRSVQVTSVIGTTNIGFNYGVQVGNGGLDMRNSSTIVGNVYSNANIVGTNSANIQGTAIAAGTGIIEGMDVGGNAQAYTIRGSSNITGNANVSSLQNSTVNGNVFADSISNCTIGGSATYDTRSSCTVGGTSTTPNSTPYSQAPSVDMPISEAQIDEWEADAEAGGTLTTQTFSSGTRSLGPVKINGDLILTNTAQLTVTGTIWVTGEIRLSNSAIVRLSPGYGGLSGVIIAGTDESSVNGYIEIINSTQILGSGTSGSYLMMLSQREGTASTAINFNNGGTSAILYAGEGKIEIGNSGTMKEVTAGLLTITNSATITYETGLANTAFSSGPGGGWEIQDGTWQLLD